MATKFGHEALAKAHHFIVGLAFGIEVGTTLTAAHRQRGQAVLQHLLETQEFQDALVHAGVETQPALVGADRAVEFNPEAPVDLNLAGIIQPGNAEHDHPFRFDQPFDNFCLDVLRVVFQYGCERLQYFFHRLVELFFTAVFRFDCGQNRIKIWVHFFLPNRNVHCDVESIFP